jgi:hypothetical protein
MGEASRRACVGSQIMVPGLILSTQALSSLLNSSLFTIGGVVLSSLLNSTLFTIGWGGTLFSSQ